MKKYIRDIRNLHLLKRNSKLESGKLYVLHSESGANNIYFESKDGISYAKQVFRKHFEGMIEVLYELYTSRGLLLIVRVNEEKEIKKNWKKRGKTSSKVSTILSEIMRFSISAIAKFRNVQSGRKGGLVRENFRTYVIMGEGKVEGITEEIKEGVLSLYGQKAEYRGGKIGKGVWDFKVLVEIPLHVLRKLIFSTYSHHLPHISQNSMSFSSS